MKTFEIKVNAMNGLSSRSSAELVEEANHHKCNIKMVLENGDECDLKSIMNVFAISTISQGESLKIVCDGADEDLAVAGFKKLASEYSF